MGGHPRAINLTGAWSKIAEVLKAFGIFPFFVLLHVAFLTNEKNINCYNKILRLTNVFINLFISGSLNIIKCFIHIGYI